jgi:hypothetical protein
LYRPPNTPTLTDLKGNEDISIYDLRTPSSHPSVDSPAIASFDCSGCIILPATLQFAVQQALVITSTRAYPEIYQQTPIHPHKSPMHAIRQKCRPKHQVLILKCYPRTTKGAVDVKPNSSELSYLLYYATTRRSKVQKVGAFLEKKTATDVWRARIGYGQDSSFFILFHMLIQIV